MACLEMKFYPTLCDPLAPIAGTHCCLCPGLPCLHPCCQAPHLTNPAGSAQGAGGRQGFGLTLAKFSKWPCGGGV